MKKPIAPTLLVAPSAKGLVVQCLDGSAPTASEVASAARRYVELFLGVEDLMAGTGSVVVGWRDLQPPPAASAQEWRRRAEQLLQAAIQPAIHLVFDREANGGVALEAAAVKQFGAALEQLLKTIRAADVPDTALARPHRPSVH